MMLSTVPTSATVGQQPLVSEVVFFHQISKSLKTFPVQEVSSLTQVITSVLLFLLPISLTVLIIINIIIIIITRSYAALRAADLEWIVGPGYSLGGYTSEKHHKKLTWNHEKT